jgi:MEMO1 family protein
MAENVAERRRAPAVAGRFYPGSGAALDRAVDELMPERAEARALAVMAPHAGYMYSGRMAGRVFGSIAVPERVVVLSPNHTGRGAPLALWASGAWELPSGDVPVDEELAARIMETHRLYRDDPRAHAAEHGVEVELPFLRRRNPRMKLVAIVISGLDLETLVALGEGLARVIEELGEPVLLVASSDMSHYLPASEAAVLDRLALDRFEALDARGLFDVVERNRITMCGYMPATVTLTAARALGATRSQVVGYTHSGVVTGDHSSVVAYAGAVVS